MLLFISFILVSCSGEDVEVKNVVIAYNKMKMEALSKPDFRIMEYFTSTQELLRIEAYITYLKKDKKLIVSELRAIDIDDNVAIEEDKAVVRTSEEWVFHYIDEKTRKPITSDETIKYENTYHLIRTMGHWVVDNVEVKELAGNR
jgi:hypothetical protein